MKKINDEAIINIKEAMPLIIHKLDQIEDHLDNGIFHDTEKISGYLNTIQKLVTEMKKQNKNVVVSE
ncbi:MAG TPA: hypothetical protein VL854_06785 [Nitrososphaeraceae archaeon]|nr:hypothetical protein [Nitrososphaeraceae archaeon]